MENIVVSALTALCAAWMAGFAYLMRAFKQVPRLERLTVPLPDRWPRLSVIIPACNEAEHLESAIMTLIRQDYPKLEIILVNDRSSDATGFISERLAAVDARISTIHIRTLPDGWLGKVHALHRGIAQANGDWMLFTDADVQFCSGMLRRAMAFALHQGCDHLALVPRTIQKSFWLDVVVRAFGLLFLLGTRAAGVNQPGSKGFIGIGAFNLVKAVTLRRTPGFEWLRLEPADDVGLGMMIKQAGGISRFALAHEDLTVEWYPSVAAMFRGLEKNLFGPGANYRWWLMLAEMIAILSVVAAPWLAFGLGLAQGSMPLAIAGAGAVAMHVWFALFCAAESRTESLSLLLFPIGMLMIAAMLLRAGYKCIKNDGIDWRGTHYPLEELRAGQRVKFLKLRATK